VIVGARGEPDHSEQHQLATEEFIMTPRIAARSVKLAVLAAATLGLTFAAAGTANATVGSPSARLSIHPYISGSYTVAVDGLIPMTKTEAQQMLNSGDAVVYSLWGADPASNDYLGGEFHVNVQSATAQGLEFHAYATWTAHQLDEDNSFYDNHDEIYASVRLSSSRGGTIRSANTAEVGGYF
jgi:hypothetical protein